MGTTNIFMNPYEQPENRLTYSFLCLIEHLDPEAAVGLIAGAGITVDRPASVRVETLYGGGSGNPDGSIHIETPARECLNVFLESKTWRRRLDLDQIRRHIATHLRSRADLLLVITADRSDRDCLLELGDDRVYFTTWHDLIARAEGLARARADAKDQFLLQQFAEYLERSGEAWRARMVDARLISSYSEWLRVKDYEGQFVNESWKLIDALKDEIVQNFPAQIKEAKMASHWGRIGAECQLRKDPLGQWLFFGVYRDTWDHGIPFKKELQPEFAIFLDIDPKNREHLAQAVTSDHIEELARLGFEFNFPENRFGNPWRLCFWREPMEDHAGDDLADLQQMFVEKLKALFESKFYKELEAIS